MDFCDLNYCELTFSITALANSLAKDLNDEEVFLLSKIFSQLSNTLNTIASIRIFCEKKVQVDINQTSNTDKEEKWFISKSM